MTLLKHGTCAGHGRVYTAEAYLLLELYKLQRTVLHLDVFTLQKPVLHLDKPTQQRPVLHPDMSILSGIRGY
jgi:hypothetical protein